MKTPIFKSALLTAIAASLLTSCNTKTGNADVGKWGVGGAVVGGLGGSFFKGKRLIPGVNNTTAGALGGGLLGAGAAAGYNAGAEHQRGKNARAQEKNKSGVMDTVR